MSRSNALCLSGQPYPFDLVEKSLDIVVPVPDEESLADACTLFTSKVFMALGRPGVTVHPRALLRAVVEGRRRRICPHSWPTPRWASMMIEQVSFDTAGMTPRLLYNDKPWLGQPAIYTQVFGIITSARKVVKDWSSDSKKDKK